MPTSASDKPSLCIGAMSGTSLDGVDAALYAIDLNAPNAARFVQRAHAYEAYDDALRARLLEVCGGASLPVGELGRLDQRVAAAYVRAITRALEQADASATDLAVIGMHGQTVHHEPQGPDRHTTQIGDPNRVAAAFDTPVVADFRRRDMALSGQGAPLAPSFHQMVLRDAERVRMVINCGGIANVTVLAPGRTTHGFDTGPANILMDEWIGQHMAGQRYDAGGQWARQGRVVDGLLRAMLAEPYFALPSPKSTGRELFNAQWLRRVIGSSGHASAASMDVQRTLLELTARSIAEAIDAQAAPPGDAIVCGGGARNTLLMERLAQLLPRWRVQPSDAFGIPAQSMEVLAFATFALYTLLGQPSSEPAVTGASRACLLGTVFMP